MGQAGYGQDQKLADSLVMIYQKDTLRDKAQLQLLADLSFNEVRNLELALQYAEELISLSRTAGDNLYLSQGYYQKGNKKRLSGDLPDALDAYFKCTEVAAKAGFTPEPAVYAGIADIYGISKKTWRRDSLLQKSDCYPPAGQRFYQDGLCHFKCGRRIPPE